MTLAKHVSQDAFDTDILQADRPVLVDFHAAWCGPCRAQGPIVDRLAREFEGRAAVAKVDADEATDVAARYGIRSLPTLLLFKNGDVVGKLVGAQRYEVLRSKLEDVLTEA